MLSVCTPTGNPNDCFSYEHYLHEKEKDLYRSYASLKRQKEFLLGRFVAKASLLTYKNFSHPMNDISIEKGFMGHPFFSTYHEHVSLSHSNHAACALIYPPSLVAGVDMELLKPNASVEFLSRYVQKKEMDAFINAQEWCYEGINNFFDDDSLVKKEAWDMFSLMTLWSAKEAVSKSFRCGLGSLLEALSIASVSWSRNLIICRFKHISALVSVSFMYKKFVISVALPSKFLCRDT
jgi:phosphopantetheinyl transferase (holo-ACP synthase)